MMGNYDEKKCKCRLCESYFYDNEMSEEHYPARSTGNEDIVAVDLIKMIDTLTSPGTKEEIDYRMCQGEKLEQIVENIFDNRLSTPMHPGGRTARTLCKKCNAFLGKYDEAYLKFFNEEGKPKRLKGFQQQTKYQVIKAIYGKFLSIPEATTEEFDFIDFVRDENSTAYNGKWKIFFVKRDIRSDILGMKDIGTGKAVFEEGVVYEMSDEKFIFNLMNFEKHECFNMTPLFDILKKSYTLVEGVGEKGGYHSQIIRSRLLSEMDEEEVVRYTKRVIR